MSFKANYKNEAAKNVDFNQQKNVTGSVQIKAVSERQLESPAEPATSQ